MVIAELQRMAADDPGQRLLDIPVQRAARTVRLSADRAVTEINLRELVSWDDRRQAEFARPVLAGIDRGESRMPAASRPTRRLFSSDGENVCVSEIIALRLI